MKFFKLIFKEIYSYNIIEMNSTTVLYTDINRDDISFSQWKDAIMFQYQNKSNTCIQSPWIELTHYGIPRKDKYHETEQS